MRCQIVKHNKFLVVHWTLSYHQTMNEDFSVLLAEYTRLLSTISNNNPGISFSESPAVIPILLRHGAFTPSRLERWPFPAILKEIQLQPSYRASFIQSFNELVLYRSLQPSDPFTLNEKKGVAMLLATKDSFPQIQESLHSSIVNHPRLLLAGIEYTALPLDMCLELPCPFPPADTLAPKLKLKYPLLISMLASPIITTATTALHRLQSSINDPEAKLVLSCAARSLHSRSVYEEIIAPVWESNNEALIAAVFAAISRCDNELKDFCQSHLDDNK